MRFEIYYPVKPRWVNQSFGHIMPVYTSLGLAGHNGIDFMADHGQPVYAAHDGTCYPEIDVNGGNGVVIRTDETYDYNGQKVHFKSIYWHLMQADAVVKTGQKVKAGDLIGYADSTGLSTGDHLHFAIKPQAWNETDWTWYNVEQTNGYFGAIDPQQYFNGFYAQDAVKVVSLLTQVIALLKNSLGIS